MAVWISVWHFGLTKPKTRALNSPGLRELAQIGLHAPA